MAFIAPLAKLGRFETAADSFPSYCVTTSLPRGGGDASLALDIAHPNIVFIAIYKIYNYKICHNF